jgi:hypothetical protein
MLAVLFPVMCFAADTENLPEVSVVIPIYNGKTYLARSLNSVLNQSFKNLEIVCVDDGSTDGSLEILKQYAARDPRIVILENGINRGTLYARLRGILCSNSKYIMTLDCDDEFLPGIIVKAHEIATEHHADIVHFGSKFVDRQGKEWRQRQTRRPILAVLDGQKAVDTFVNIRNVFLWDKMFARGPILAAARYLFPWAEQHHVVCGEDTITLAFTTKNIRRYVGIEDLGYSHSSSTGTTAELRQCPAKFFRMLSSHHQAYLKMAIGMVELGDPTRAALLLRRFRAPFYEHIVTLQLPEGVDLLSKYIAPMPPDMRLKVARQMRCASPGWCRKIHQLARTLQSEIHTGGTPENKIVASTLPMTFKQQAFAKSPLDS